MKCQKCNKCLQDNNTVAYEGKVYCFECFKKVEIAMKALERPAVNKMVEKAPKAKSVG